MKCSFTGLYPSLLHLRRFEQGEDPRIGAILADGTSCDDGDAGTIDDQCNQGVCSGVTPPAVVCPCDFSEATLDCVFAGASSPFCFDSTADDTYLLVYSAGDSDDCDGNTLTNPNAIVEYVSSWNWDLAGLPAESWPSEPAVRGAPSSSNQER